MDIYSFVFSLILLILSISATMTLYAGGQQPFQKTTTESNVLAAEFTVNIFDEDAGQNQGKADQGSARQEPQDDVDSTLRFQKSDFAEKGKGKVVREWEKKWEEEQDKLKREENQILKSKGRE